MEHRLVSLPRGRAADHEVVAIKHRRLDLRQDVVVIDRHATGRLGPAHRQYLADLQSAHRINAAALAYRLRCLGEDVVGQLIGVVLATTGDIQLTVAGRTPIAQLVDTYPLGRDANPGKPGPGQLLPMPERIEIIAGSDVLPLHDHGAVEVKLRARFAHHYAGYVGHILGDNLARGAIASGRAREVELLLHIAAPHQFTLGGKEWIGVVQVG